jgi:hypothetical protein
VNKLDNNDYIKVRSVDFGDDGAEKFYAAVNGGSGTIEIHLDKQDGEMVGQLAVTAASNFEEQNVEVSGAVGIHDMFFVFKGGNSMFEWDYWYFENSKSAIPQSPFCGVGKENCEPASIPGKIEVEDYDAGGANKAYSDTDTENRGGAYREDRVDVYENDADGYSVGYTEAGEWLEYTVNVTDAEVKTWTARVASGNATSSFQLFLDGEAITDTIKVPQTDSTTWDVYTEIEGDLKPLAAGEHVLKLLVTGSWVDIDWIAFGEEAQEPSEPKDPTSLLGVGALKAEGSFQVFSLQGKYLGEIQSSSVRGCQQIIRDRFPMGIYVVKDGSRTYRMVGK